MGIQTIEEGKRELICELRQGFYAERVILGQKQEASTYRAEELESHSDQSSSTIC